VTPPGEQGSTMNTSSLRSRKLAAGLRHFPSNFHVACLSFPSLCQQHCSETTLTVSWACFDTVLDGNRNRITVLTLLVKDCRITSDKPPPPCL
jgi:hypothetical protein